MPILTSFDVEQKRMAHIIRINKTAALEQRSAIKFCVENKKSRQEAFEMLIKALRVLVGTAALKRSNREVVS